MCVYCDSKTEYLKLGQFLLSRALRFRGWVPAECCRGTEGHRGTGVELAPERSVSFPVSKDRKGFAPKAVSMQSPGGVRRKWGWFAHLKCSWSVAGDEAVEGAQDQPVMALKGVLTVP